MWQVIILCLSFSFSYFTNASPIKQSPIWWENDIIYQIYPRSFKDTDGDGVGDLNGISSKLGHIRDIADTFWLSPIYPSPQKDFGYDVSNFKDIDPQYGTLEEFEILVAKAKFFGLRVLLDFVPNHSSNEHEWFKKSVKRIKPYDEYYVWKDGKLGPNGTILPPNNWLSQFTGSAWEWNEERGQYYYHQYAVEQPDLNYRSLHVQREMKDVLTFWLDRGVDGFRVDAIAHLFEDQLLRDEPRSKEAVPPNDYNYLEHIYTRDLNETYEIVRSWKEYFDEYSIKHSTEKKVLLMEVGSRIPFVMKYYNIGVDPFNFGFVHDLNNASTAKDFRNNILNWLNNMPQGKIANWIVGNHDVGRVASRFGYENNRADELSMLSTVLPGITIIYNGDEIGMVNRFFTYEETVDPAGCNAGPERYQLKSRDPERTPYQWDDSISAGFSSNPKTWLPVHENYKILNLANQKEAKISHYKVFQALSKLKKSIVLAKGNTKVLLITDKVLAVVRRLPNSDPIVLLINFDFNTVEVNVGASIKVPKTLAIYIASVKSGLITGDVLHSSRVSLPGSSSVILTSKEMVSILLNIV